MDYKNEHEGVGVTPPITSITVHKNRVIYRDSLGVKSKQLNNSSEKNHFIKALLVAH